MEHNYTYLHKHNYKSDCYIAMYVHTLTYARHGVVFAGLGSGTWLVLQST